MDLALVHRLATSQFVMDTTMALTRGINPLEAALLAVVPLADLGLPTLVLREHENGYIGQIRHRAGTTHAFLALLAPTPRQKISYAPWLQLVDGLVVTAGRRGALIVTADISDTAYAAFEILRQTGFIVYTRQIIYKRPPAKIVKIAVPNRVQLRLINDKDTLRLRLLYNNLVPSLVQQADPNGETQHGPADIVIESTQENRLLGHLALTEGKSGLLVKPLLHPDVFDEAVAIVGHALHFWRKIERLPLYFCVRAYQEWLGTHLLDLGFEQSDRQIVLVKHTTVRPNQAVDHATLGVDTVLGSLI